VAIMSRRFSAARISSAASRSSADGVREHIEHAITRQAAQRAAAEPLDKWPAKPACTDLELVRAQIRQLRAERDELRGQARLHLGRQLELLASGTLTDRIDELTRHGQLLADQHQRAAAENQLLRQRVTDLADGLAATRTSLRRMIRNTSRSKSRDRCSLKMTAVREAPRRQNKRALVLGQIGVRTQRRSTGSTAGSRPPGLDAIPVAVDLRTKMAGLKAAASRTLA
jgi:hypothetical protein